MNLLYRIAVLIAIVLAPGCEQEAAEALREKADATKARIEARFAEGADVAEAVRLARQVKQLADGKLAEANRLLDRINALLDEAPPAGVEDDWTDLGPIEIRGYDGHAMEPFLSRDGKALFFNNRNSPSDNTNLHWAERLGPGRFDYRGELKGVNTSHLEGVPSMDRHGNFFFVSTREYDTSRVSVFRGRFRDGEVTEVRPVAGISRRRRGWINMDLEVSADGDRLYFTHSYFSGKPVPSRSDLSVAVKDGDDFSEAPSGTEVMREINTADLQYAPATSDDELTLYWTHAKAPLGTAGFEIRRATRPDVDSPFGKPETIATLKGYVEAPTVHPDTRTIYYHRRIDGRFRICALKGDRSIYGRPAADPGR